MIKILSGIQMRNVDQKAISDLKIPSLILMENAGRAVCSKVIEILRESKSEYENVLVICGKGNNGGDGFVAARHLIENGIQTFVVSIYEENELSGDALINHNILKHYTDIIYFQEIESENFKDMISVSTVLIDAIFGTGLSSEIKGDINDIINHINEYAEGDIISVDISSGIDSNTGKVLGNAILADYTVTFLAPKLGSVIYPGADYSGEIVSYDISIPSILLDDPEFNINLITDDYIYNTLPYRPDNSHKGSYGKVFNVAGSLGMTGAAYMSSFSSLKVGAGYSIIATPKSLIPTIARMSPEIILVPLAESVDQFIHIESLDLALEKSKDCSCILIGPGIGTNLSTVEFVSNFIKKLTDRGEKVIIDADALNCLALKKEFILPLNSIITPHPKELSRLLEVSLENILADRIKYARFAAEKFNTIVVLKGARTIIAEPNGNVYINPTGNSGLATAGTGDILAGMIAGFVAQNLKLKDAANLGVYLHGLAGDLGEKDLTEYALTASDLLNYIPKAIKQVLC